MTINLYNTDCMQALRDMPDNMYDLAIVDPPYGLSESGAHTHTTTHTKGKKYARELKHWDIKPPREYFDELRRVSKNQIIFGMNYFMDMLPPSRCYVVWDTCTRGLGFSQCELAWASFPEMCKYIRVNKTQINRIHRCQKPVQLYEWILQNYAKQGDRILDTHLGSGSIAVACHNTGHSLDAYEIDAEYFAAASARLHEHQRQIKLFT